MIIASSKGDRINATSAAIESNTLSLGRTPPEPTPQPTGANTVRQRHARTITRHASTIPRHARTLRRLNPGAIGMPSAEAIRETGAETLVLLLLLGLAVSAFLPWTRFELHTTADQVAVETATTLISTLAALLFFDRFWRHLRRRDMLLASGLALIAASNLGAGLLLANDLELAGHSAAWIVLGGRIAGWLLIVGATLLPNRVIPRPSRVAIRTVCRCAAGVAALAMLALLLSAHPTSSETSHGGPLGNHTAMLAAQIVLVVLTSAAALALLREIRRDRSPTARLLALACAFAAAAALANCADPSFYASRVGVGDLLRLGWLTTLFACVCVQWSLDERHAPATALARERRRMAADVHDLIMQDLSFALAHARTLVDDPARPQHASTVVSAGERALAGARDVVSGLTAHDNRPIAQAVEASVRAAARHTPLTFDAQRAPTSATLDRPLHGALVHIAREAVTNAVKHASPSAIEVVLEYAGQWRLTVRDDGNGFDEAPANPGFGLLSMRQSAHALGGAVHVGSAPGGGTTVEAVIP